MQAGKLSLITAAILGLATPALALDFTAQESWRAQEGARIPLLLFSDATGKIRYQPPGSWHFSGGGAVFTLYPPGGNGAFMKFTVLGHTAGLAPITDLPSADLTKWSQNFIATNAEEVTLLDENPSPFTLSGRPSREFVFSYKSSGQRFQTSVAVLDWNEREHLAVVITALAADFKAVHEAGTSSLFSWSLRKADTPRATPSIAGSASASPAPSTPTTAAPPGPTPIKARSR